MYWFCNFRFRWHHNLIPPRKHHYLCWYAWYWHIKPSGNYMFASTYLNVKRFCQLTFLVHFVTRHSFGFRRLLEHNDFLVRRILLVLSRTPSSKRRIFSNINSQCSPQPTTHKGIMSNFNQSLSTLLGSDAKREWFKQLGCPIKVSKKLFSIFFLCLFDICKKESSRFSLYLFYYLLASFILHCINQCRKTRSITRFDILLSGT